jgi:outer membrane protein TolC
MMMAIVISVAFAGTLSAQTPLTIPQAIRLAGEHSSAVRSTYHDSLSAAHNLAAARALRFPTLSATAVSFYTDEVQTIDLPFAGVELGDNENYQADLRLSLPLYAGGRISNQIRVQSAMARSRGYSHEARRLQAAYDTRRAYLSLMAAQAAARAVEASLARVGVVSNDVQNLFASGMADSLDILDAELALQRAQQAHRDRLTAADNAAALLARLTGLTKAEIVLQDESMPPPDFETYENIGGVPDNTARPELQALESRVDAARSSIGLNRAGYLPTLSAYGNYTVGKPGRDIIEKEWNDYWTAGVNLSWEFNLGGRAFRNVSSAKEAARSAAASREDLGESLRLAADIAYDNMRLAYQNSATALREYQIAERKYALGLESRRAGDLSVNRLLELEADLTSTEQLHNVAVINYYLSETEYLYAIGSSDIYGGF